MNHLFRLILGASLTLIALTVVACFEKWDATDPAAYVPSTDYPCGVIGVVCGRETDGVGYLCCNEGEACGGKLSNPGCPAGECCNNRPFDPSVFSLRSRDGGVVDAAGSYVVTVRGAMRVSR